MPDVIQKNPKVLGGQPVIKGTRIPVSRVLALVGMGYSLKKLKNELPDLEKLTKKDLGEIFSYYKARIAV